MRCIALPVLLIGLAVTGGCANRSLTENQCVAGDWETVGFADGQAGASSSRLLQHQDACGRFGVVPNRTAYLRGWEQGMTQFCRPENGFQVGISGGGYGGQCPGDLHDAFLGAYEDGRTLFLARRDVAQLESTLSRNEQRLEYIDGRLLKLAAEQINVDLTAQERIDLFNETKSLMEERDRLEQSLPALRQDLAEAVARLEYLDRYPT